MTDKKIIHGVDVSGCKYKTTTRFNPVTLRCDNTEPRCRGGNDGFCKDHPNCYYKQSARKGERIKELEKKLSRIAKLADKADCVISHCVYHEMTNETEILKELYRFGKSGELNRIKLVNESVFELDTILQQIKQIAQGE